MKVDIIISACDVKASKVKGRTAVIIDVLRATSVIVTAFQNGCKEVIPVRTIEEAFEMKKKINDLNPQQRVFVGGERNALKIEGFDLSNSPFEYLPSLVNGSTLIITTTNGTQAVNEVCDGGPKKVLIGSSLNLDAVIENIFADPTSDVVIVNSGTDGMFTLDDFICGGFLLQRMLEKGKDRNITFELTDICHSCLALLPPSSPSHPLSSSPQLFELLKKALHVQRLLALGLEKDILYCFDTTQRFSVLPSVIVEGGVRKLVC